MFKKTMTLTMALLALSFLVSCGGGGEKKEAAPARKATKKVSAAAGYETIAVANGGSLEGRVTLAGLVPKMKKLKVTKDVNVCGKVTHYDESMVVSDDKGLANVVVRLTDITSGKDMESLGDSFVLNQQGCAFHPHVALVPVGAPLTIMNSDGILHNIHTYGTKNKSSNVAQPGFRKKMTHTFDAAEVVRVACDVHNWMSGYIVVAENPYYAITDASGAFSLTDVPAGTYTVEFWQETLGKQTQEVAVTAGATAKADVEFSSGS